MSERLLSGWGRTAPSAARVVPARAPQAVADAVRSEPSLIARGLGRSYGDPAQNAGGAVLDCTSLDGPVDLDPAAGTVTAEAGVSLDTLMRVLLPQGWFVPVTPGTRQVTVGGAIASDIHGKNHHRDGSFGHALVSLDLVLASGECVTVSPESRPEVFRATVGGLGLTGIVTRATFRVLPVETSSMVVDTERANDLDSCMAAMVDGDDRYPYSVAWIDLLASGARTGRSVLTRGRHATAAEAGPKAASSAFSPSTLARVPLRAPNGLLNRATVRAFNEVWFRKAPWRRIDEVLPLAAFFHPLDIADDWNLLYGSRGFLQWQCVVPDDAADVMRGVVQTLSSSGVASFLAVLKRMGPTSLGHLSFPLPGWTLALDLPLGRRDLGPLLDDLDERVADAGGRIYLAKDSRARPATVARMYPRLAEWQGVVAEIDPGGRFRSDLSRRLHLRG